MVVTKFRTFWKLFLPMLAEESRTNTISARAWHSNREIKIDINLLIPEDIVVGLGIVLFNYADLSFFPPSGIWASLLCFSPGLCTDFVNGNWKKLDIYVCVYVPVHVCVCVVWACLYLCMCVFLCVFVCPSPSVDNQCWFLYVSATYQFGKRTDRVNTRL